jgi:hypothetical protein
VLRYTYVACPVAFAGTGDLSLWARWIQSILLLRGQEYMYIRLHHLIKPQEIKMTGKQ